ncbi:MAG: DUF4176 domain-containing protein [Lachnospiraceae bacterium]|nr:DUF4176 domain-containing protein [Lachnospiraceae bacterium]
MDFELLPIGTVVKMKNSAIPVMIAGYLSVVTGKEDRIWDYSGFIFPNGYNSDEDILSFDHEQIEFVIAYGYRDIQEERFVAQVSEARQELREDDGEDEEDSDEDDVENDEDGGEGDE